MACNQFDSFDGLDNRKEIYILLERLGDGDAGNMRRAAFLKSLIPLSVSVLAGHMKASLRIDPSKCTPAGAYNLFIAITGILGVPIYEAAKKLDREVTRQCSMRSCLPFAIKLEEPV